MDQNGKNKDASLHLMERISTTTEYHKSLLEEHAQILQEHAGTLKEIRMHLYKLDDIATNTGKLASSVDNALGRVFTMLEKRDEGSRRGAIIITSVIGTLLIILALAATKLELTAGSKDGHNITIKERLPHE